jgi:hypothetical protein
VKRITEGTRSRYNARSQSNLSDMPAEMMSVAAFNHYLKSESGRREWGWMRDSRELENTFHICGVLITAPSEDIRGKNELKVTTTEGKRAKLANVWCCSARPVNRGDYLYYIWERCRLETEMDDGKDDPNDVGKGTQAPAWYWRLTPVHMPPREKPPAEMYMRESFRGNFFFYGAVDDVYIQDGEKPGQQSTIARRAMFPEFADPEVRRKDMTKLRKIQAQLGVHA